MTIEACDRGVGMRLLDCAEQGGQPPSQSEDELVEFDVKYLVRCLGTDRCTSYRLIKRPDVEERHSPQPDYLAEETETGASLVIEHARFFESQESREAEARKLRRSDILISWLRTPSAQQLGERLSEFADHKLGKGQFSNFKHAERILLARNRWSGVRIERFLKAEPYFELRQPAGCDHFHIIVSKRLVEVF